MSKAKARKKTKEIKVFMAMVSHRHGNNFYAGTSEAELQDKLYAYITDWWSEFVATAIPKDKAAAVKQYFMAASEQAGNCEFIEYGDGTIEVSV